MEFKDSVELKLNSLECHRVKAYSGIASSPGLGSTCNNLDSMDSIDVHASEGNRHSTCLRCCECGEEPGEWYMWKNQRLYCRRDYWTTFRHLCLGCSRPISGPVMVAGEFRYHPECFQCQMCLGCIGYAEPFVLQERSFLYCKDCFQAGSNGASLESESPPINMIQMVHVPATSKTTDCGDLGVIEFEKTCTLEEMSRPNNYRNSLIHESSRLASSAVLTKLEENKRLDFLKVGDRIIEVNGLSTHDRTTKDLTALLNDTSTPINITLERNFSTSFPKREGLCSPTSPSICFSPSPEIERKLESENTSSLKPSAKEEVIMIENSPVRLRPKSSLKARGHSPSRRRSKSPSPCPTSRQKSMDLGRSHSFTTHKTGGKIFRPVDLIIQDVIGQGFFGRALKASHRITGEHMVLKELHNFDEDAQKSLIREISILRNLDHPCVLKFMGVLYRDKKLNLITEFIDGGTLTELLLDTSVELSWVQRLRFVKDIAAGMSYLHSMDIIHRDLNSQNCFIRQNQSAVVADFGLAKIVPRHDVGQIWKPEKTKTGKKKRFSRRKRQTVVGNPYWMAPEMISQGVYDEKIDVFSYGIIVCETIARVTADPDYMPRSIDFGLNVESFFNRFCLDTPEPYTMLGVLCSQIEPDLRPSFENIVHLCEALLLYLEHNRTVPSELQGSVLELYRSTKTRLYGADYRDIDSVDDGTKRRSVQQQESSVQKPVVDNASLETTSVLHLVSADDKLSTDTSSTSLKQMSNNYFIDDSEQTEHSLDISLTDLSLYKDTNNIKEPNSLDSSLTDLSLYKNTNEIREPNSLENSYNDLLLYKYNDSCMHNNSKKHSVSEEKDENPETGISSLRLTIGETADNTDQKTVSNSLKDEAYFSCSSSSISPTFDKFSLFPREKPNCDSSGSFPSESNIYTEITN